jgi:predicted Rossmann-fold nucleotide-binding protein
LFVVSDVTTWTQRGLHAKPPFVLIVAGYCDLLRAMPGHALASGFIAPDDDAVVTFARIG